MVPRTLRVAGRGGCMLSGALGHDGRYRRKVLSGRPPAMLGPDFAMRLVRIAVVSVNTTVGAVRSNVDRALELTRAAAADGATLVVLPEQVVGGYMQEDLVQWRSFVDA